FISSQRSIFSPYTTLFRSIADEIYSHIVYNGQPVLHMSEWIGDVPGIAMRGISKEYPWPGARCGWLEILNKGKDREFAEYVDSRSEEHTSELQSRENFVCR